MDNHVAGLFNPYNILMISWFLINEAFLILIQITISFVFRCEPEYFGFVCINEIEDGYREDFKQQRFPGLSWRGYD